MSKKQKPLTVAQTNTANAVDNLACSIFRWEGLPYEMSPPSEQLEFLLFKRGAVGCFDTNFGPMIFPCVISRLNQWGLPAEGSAQPIIIGNSGIQVVQGGNAPIVLYDQPSHTCILDKIDWYSDSLGKLRHAIDTCTMWLKTPVIFEASETQEQTLRTLIARIERGDSAIAIYDGAISIDGIKITPTSVTPAVLQALHDGYIRTRAMLYEELGIPDVNNAKMAQQTQTEILMPMLDTALKTLSRLYMRREFCDRINALYATNVSVYALTLGLIEQSLYASTGEVVNLADVNRNGIPDIVEKESDKDEQR